MTSHGKPFSHLRSSGSALRWTACYAAGSATFTESFGWVFSAGVRARVLRTGFRVALESDGRKKQENKRESNAVAPRFKLSDLGPAHRRLVESECPYGVEPRLARFLGHAYVI